MVIVCHNVDLDVPGVKVGSAAWKYDTVAIQLTVCIFESILRSVTSILLAVLFARRVCNHTRRDARSRSRDVASLGRLSAKR